MDVDPLKKSAKKLVNVMTPSAPIWMRMAIMICPRGVNVAGISTGVRPVIDTALVLTNNESM